MKDIADFIGRVFISFIFLFEAYDSLAYSKHTVEKMAEYGLTWQPYLLLYGAVFVLILGGLLVLTGYRSAFGAILLLTYWIPITFLVHHFWSVPAENFRSESILFINHLAITGGLLVIIGNGSGRYSIRKLFATTKVK